MPNLQYENVKKAQAEAQVRQQAQAGQQPKFDQQQQASVSLVGLCIEGFTSNRVPLMTASLQGAKETVASRIGYRK